MPASIFYFFRALRLRRRRRNCDARKYLNFLKFEIYAQNHFIFLKKLKRPKNLSYRKEQNLVLWEFFLCSFHLKKNNFCFAQIWEGFAIATPASQSQCPEMLAGIAIATPASRLRRRPDCLTVEMINFLGWLVILYNLNFSNK